MSKKSKKYNVYIFINLENRVWVEQSLLRESAEIRFFSWRVVSFCCSDDFSKWIYFYCIALFWIFRVFIKLRVCVLRSLGYSVCVFVLKCVCIRHVAFYFRSSFYHLLLYLIFIYQSEICVFIATSVFKTSV